jgi:hypothetical protein
VKDNNTVDQLRTLNELFARTGESAPGSAEHIRRVLDFFSEVHDEDSFALPFSEGVDRLAQLHFGPSQQRRLRFAHWDVPVGEQFSPLWIRQALISRIKRLSGSSAAFLLITGLRKAICPEGSYWTGKRQEYYDCVCDYINELACSWLTHQAKLNVVVM